MNSIQEKTVRIAHHFKGQFRQLYYRTTWLMESPLQDFLSLMLLNFFNIVMGPYVDLNFYGLYLETKFATNQLELDRDRFDPAHA